MMVNSNSFVMTDAGWRHRPLFKVAANTLLRAIQAWSDTPLLIVSVCTVPDDGGMPELIGYRVRKIKMTTNR